MRRKAAEGSLDYAEWWKGVWAKPELPVIQDPVAPTHVARNETGWLKAYNVPGAIDVIKERKYGPVQAICLSGGGVRSACVAMGATQVFSEAKPINPKKTDTPSPAVPRRLIDTVDYVISVSGGGFTAGARLLATQRRDKASGTQPSDKAYGRPLVVAAIRARIGGVRPFPQGLKLYR